MSTEDKRNWTFVKDWLEYSPDFIENIQSNNLDYYDRMRRRVLEYARSCTASDRLSDLEVSISQDQFRSTYRLVANGFVTILGSFFYARASLLVFVSLGDLAYFASMLVGIGFSYILDQLVTGILANHFYYQHCLDLDADLRHEDRFKSNSKNVNLLKKEFNDEYHSFVKYVEKSRKKRGFSIEIIVAISLSIIEYISTIAIINNVLGDLVEIPLPLLIILGFLPVLLTWAAGTVKAKKFEIFELFQKPISRYYKEISVPIAYKDPQKWLKEQQIEDEKLNAAIQVILNNLSSSVEENIPTPGSAEYIFDMEYFDHEVQKYKKQKEDEITNLKDSYMNDEFGIDQKWAAEIEKRKNNKPREISKIFSQIRQNNKREVQRRLIEQLREILENQDIHDFEQQIIDDCNVRRDEAKKILKSKLDFDIQLIESEFNPIINFNSNKRNQAEEGYRNELSAHSDAIDIERQIEELYRKFQMNWPS